MNPDYIEILIAEAKELSVNVHDHVALKLYGVSTPDTRQKAKDLTFIYLYGGIPKATKEKIISNQMGILKKFDAAYPALKAWRNQWGRPSDTNACFEEPFSSGLVVRRPSRNPLPTGSSLSR